MDTANIINLKPVADAALEAPVVLTVDINPRSEWMALLQRSGLIARQKTFIIKPIFFGSLLRISPLLAGIGIDGLIDKEKRGETGLLEMSYNAIAAHANTMAEIIAIAIQNNSKAPDRKLIRFILDNFTAKEMLDVLSIVLKQMDIQSFIKSIISIKGLSVLENKIANANSAETNEVSL